MERWHENRLDTTHLHGHVYRMLFENSNPNPKMEASEAWPEYYNFFIGNNPNKWAGKVKAFSKFTYRELYPLIDLEVFSGNGGLKYNFIVKPGGNPHDIKIKYEGLDKTTIENGQLILQTSQGSLTESLPAVYDQEFKPVVCAYNLKDNIVSFNLGSYRRNKKLIIDPVLVFSTYSGSFADNFGCTGTFDDLGNGYSGGTIFGMGFPASLGAFDFTFNGGSDEDLGYGGSRDVGILKYNPTGKVLLFATYIGGAENEQPHSCMVNSKGELYVMGSTRSVNFPTSNNALDRTHNGDYDIFITQLSEDGSSMIASTFVGGTKKDGVYGDRTFDDVDDLEIFYNYADEFRGEIILDDSDQVYVSSTTESLDFPVLDKVQSFAGKYDAVAFKLSSDLSTLKWSTTLGGNFTECGYGVATGKNNDVFFTGGSRSNSFAFSFNGLNKNNLGGEADGFLVRLNRNTGSLINSTFVGTSNYDQCYFVQTDNSGRPYVFGQTEGSFPVKGAVYKNQDGGQFIARFFTDLSDIDISTTIGSGGNLPNISPSAFLVDRCERIFISGWGGRTNYHIPKNHKNKGLTTGLPITSDALQKTTDGSDFYVAVFTRNLGELLYGTFFGGQGVSGRKAEEHVDGGTSRFDKKGVIYQSVCAGCGVNGLFPTTPGAWSNTNNSDNCNNALFKIDFQNLNRRPKATGAIYTVTATDNVSFTFKSTDLDFWDTLTMELSGSLIDFSKYSAPYPAITKSVGKGTASLNFSWDTKCQHPIEDTLYLYVKVKDNGCPSPDSTSAVIKVVIKNPPLTVPPAEMCVNFNDVDRTVKLDWKSFNTDRFFKKIILYRKNPDGSTTLVDSFKSNGAGTHTDKTPSDARLNNFCYYFVGENICGRLFTSPFKVCTKDESDLPIDSTYVVTATVVSDKFTKVVWRESKENDFGSYTVFKADNDLKTVYKPVWRTESLSDTTYSDYDVKVDDKSYCYKVTVSDKCGHVSPKSNPGCTILLGGNAEPFAFNLNWGDYKQWKDGVMQYELKRAYDTQSLIHRAMLSSTDFIYHDDKLNYDWGGYYYQIKGYENPGTHTATSQSNIIYLIQPPLLWVPTSFTCNEDNLNDQWGITPVFVKDYHLMVFNRWGQKVFETFNKKQQWNGVYNGHDSKENVFAWVVTFTGWDKKSYKNRGTVTVLK